MLKTIVDVSPHLVASILALKLLTLFWFPEAASPKLFQRLQELGFSSPNGSPHPTPNAMSADAGGALPFASYPDYGPLWGQGFRPYRGILAKPHFFITA